MSEHLYDTGTRSAIKPSSLKAAIAAAAPQFRGSEQHDAHELLMFLLASLHSQLNQSHDVPPSLTAPALPAGASLRARGLAAWQHYTALNQSIVVDELHGQLLSVLTCAECGLERPRFEPFQCVSVPLRFAAASS